jgi:hypothetical protein
MYVYIHIDVCYNRQIAGLRPLHMYMYMYVCIHVYVCMYACMYVCNKHTHTHTHTTTHIIADRFKSGQLSKGRHPHDVSSNIYSKVCSKDLKYCLD